MNKRAFRFVLMLMVISAISAILFQIISLKYSQQLTHKIFEENVRLAIKTTANTISEEQKNLNINIDANVDKGWYYASNDSLYSFRFYSKSKYKPPPNYNRKFYNRLEAFNQAFTENINQDTTVLKQVMIIYTQWNKNRTKTSVYEKRNIDSILKGNLKKNNIDLKYSYGFYDEKDSIFLNTGGQKLKDTLALKNTKFKYKVEGVSTIYVQLYDSKSYLYKKMLINILFSSLLVIIVISSFAYAFHIIIKQKKISQIKTDFINNMTHELKTPLATINIAIATIEEPEIIVNPKTIKQFTQIIKDENQRMNRQIELVLDVAKEDETLSNLSKNSIDMNTVLESIITNNSIRVKKGNGRIIYQSKALTSIIEGDSIHIYQAINNLVDNAIKYSKDVIDIVVTISNKNDNLIIDVTDKGIGIEKKEERLIFDKFYRISTNDVHNVKGFGLGLNYVKKIVLAHNGKVEYKRNTIGSTFTIELPLKNT